MKELAQYIFFSLIIVFSTFSFAQENGNLRGFVRDSTTSEVLPYCNIYIPEIGVGASTDQRGYYFIGNIPSNRSYFIEYSYVGYKTTKMRVYISPNKITEVNVNLSSSSHELGIIEKTAKQMTNQEKMDLGIERLTLRDLENIPQSVESDVIRSLKYIPGVSSTGDMSAKYYVRGGGGDQNLVLLNGITLYNPFHALGLFSVIDPEMVSSVDFYKGAFTSEYGGRLSSVMNVVTKDGNKNFYSGTASVSLLTAKALFEGPYKYGSFILTGRKSHSTSILDKFLPQDNVPIDFYDLSFKMDYVNPRFISNGKFTFFGFVSGDNLDDPDPAAEDFKWSNDLFGLEWVQIYDVPLFSTFRFGYSNFTGEVIPNRIEIKPKLNKVEDYSFNSEFVYVFDSKDQVTLGLSIKAISTELIETDYSGSIIELSDFAAIFAFYTKYQLLRFDDFGLDAGARMYFTGLTHKGGFSVEPRVKAFWSPLPNFALNIAVGTFRQELATVTDENEVISLFEPWTIYPDYLEPAKSINMSIGVDYFFNPVTKYSLEIYYKDIKNTLAVNEKNIFENDKPLIKTDGRAYGMENVFTYELERIRINAAYTLSWAFKTIYDKEYVPKYDTRHNISLGFNYLLGDGWRAGLAWIFNSGYAFTPVKGYYDKYEIDNLYETDPRLVNYSIFTMLGEKNIKRLPEYHRLDFTLNKQFKLGFAEVDVSFNIINVYDRKNIFYFKRDTGEKVYMLPFLPTATIRVRI